LEEKMKRIRAKIFVEDKAVYIQATRDDVDLIRTSLSKDDYPLFALRTPGESQEYHYYLCDIDPNFPSGIDEIRRFHRESCLKQSPSREPCPQ
jgi:hypothetical protein